MITLFDMKIKSKHIGIKIGQVNIALLLYADDIVLLAEDELKLQDMLNEVHDWCCRWRMLVNTIKTEVVHFRTKRTEQTKSKFKMGPKELNTVKYYKYLGCVVNEFLDNTITGDTLAEGASRALGKLLSKYYMNNGLGYKTYKKLYESCVCPVMDYGSGVWGYRDNEELDKIHMRAMRCYLGVHKHAAKSGIMGDLGWVPPSVRRKIEMLRLWNRIVGMENSRLSKVLYNHMNTECILWVRDVKELFEAINCSDVFQNNAQIVNFKEFKDYAQEKLMKIHNSKWFDTIQNKPKLHLYVTLRKSIMWKNTVKLI